MRCWWVVPFSKTCHIELRNVGSKPVHATLGPIGLGKWVWNDRSMLFHATWRQEYPIHTKAQDGTCDWNFVDIDGRGVYVGDTLAIHNGCGAWWGEGDEKIWVDDDRFPSIFGTGTEDYYGYSYGDRGTFFEAPFHAEPRWEGNRRPGHVTNTRTRGLDGIPFDHRLSMNLEIWHWEATTMAYAATTYWYAHPGHAATALRTRSRPLGRCCRGRAALCCRCGHGKTTPPLLISRRRTDNAHSPLDAGRCRYLSCVSFGLDYPSQRGAQRRPFTVRLLCDARTARRACYCRHFDVASAAIAGSTTVSRRRPGGRRAPPRVRHRLTISSAAREMRRTLAIRQVSGDRVVALVEIVSPANKDRPVSVEQFANKAEMALRQGIHVVMADLFPPGPHDPRGMHAAIWERFDEDSHSLPHDEPLTLASYVAGPMPEAYLEHLAAGTALVEMPLFLDVDHYIYLPLEPTYMAAYHGMPQRWRNVLE